MIDELIVIFKVSGLISILFFVCLTVVLFGVSLIGNIK